MSRGQSTEISSWSPSDRELCELLAAKCATIACVFTNGSPQDITHFLADMPANAETFELVARFCDGYEPNMSAENVVPISCLASYLGMTEVHCQNNLLQKALSFFEHKVLPSWNETVKAFRTTDNILDQAVQLGIVSACFESLIAKAISDPSLIGDPIEKVYFDESEGDEGDVFRPNAQRRLFVLNWKSEDLTTLSLRLYEPLMHEMIKRGVPSRYVAISLCSYARKWAFTAFAEGESVSVYRRNSQREIIEAVERLLPDERGLIACSLLFKMLRCANLLEASRDCRDGLEFRIGKDLHHATVQDLLTLSQLYARELQYDIECVRRILKHFYGNYTSADISGLIRVAELVEEFLAEIASDIDLKAETFITMAEISRDISRGTQRCSDGIYKGIDIYFDRHRHLTESERQEVCRALDFCKLSPEACDHAVKNERLPMRVVLHVMFLVQLQLRNTVRREGHSSQDGREFKVEEEEEEEARLLGYGRSEETAMVEIMEMEKISRKLAELERECGAMKREIERSDCSSLGRVVKKEKVSLWREMKRKFGCISASVSNSNCQVKRRKKKKFGPK